MFDCCLVSQQTASRKKFHANLPDSIRRVSDLSANPPFFSRSAPAWCLYPYSSPKKNKMFKSQINLMNQSDGIIPWKHVRSFQPNAAWWPCCNRLHHNRTHSIDCCSLSPHAIDTWTRNLTRTRRTVSLMAAAWCRRRVLPYSNWIHSLLHQDQATNHCYSLWLCFSI